MDKIKNLADLRKMKEGMQARMSMRSCGPPQDERGYAGEDVDA